MKKTNNKGFSLVELIVVVAIMAVLMVVLAPQYLRYVEKTRLQKDNSAIAEIANAVKIAMAEETINSAVDSNSKITIKNAANTAASIKFADNAVLKADGTTEIDALISELEAIFGTELKTESNTYNTAAAPIILKIVKTNGTVSIEVAGFIESANGTATTDTNPKKF